MMIVSVCRFSVQYKDCKNETIARVFATNLMVILMVKPKVMIAMLKALMASLLKMVKTIFLREMVMMILKQLLGKLLLII